MGFADLVDDLRPNELTQPNLHFPDRVLIGVHHPAGVRVARPCLRTARNLDHNRRVARPCDSLILHA